MKYFTTCEPFTLDELDPGEQYACQCLMKDNKILCVKKDQVEILYFDTTKCQKVNSDITRHIQQYQQEKQCEELEQQLKQLSDANNKCMQEMNLKDAQQADQEMKQYIKSVHSYNEIKDAAMTLMGRLAEFKGVPVKEMYAEYEAFDD
ncbi:hypothetical protein MP228_009572 [Amoeboaphelidium protococcarum]|nr:hypothetical protein MP228_009572 [Amoeboaphelidium protococcarum]